MVFVHPDGDEAVQKKLAAIAAKQAQPKPTVHRPLLDPKVVLERFGVEASTLEPTDPRLFESDDDLRARIKARTRK